MLPCVTDVVAAGWAVIEMVGIVGAVTVTVATVELTAVAPVALTTQ
jgi:hypothetical protein